MSVALLTNNLRWGRALTLLPWDSPSPRPEGRRCFLVEGSPLAVFLAGRSLLHAGWRLLNHPLYGNFRPHQQPYRSLIWRFEGADPGRQAAYAWSLRLFEEALALYLSSKVLSPAQAPPALRDACALLDCELLRLTLEQAGWPEAVPAA
ncbi:MAG: GrdX family protein [Deltaproteobacteria bacterium]|nr:GrdX family protein [Deltaproteobacteria bacterium]